MVVFFTFFDRWKESPGKDAPHADSTNLALRDLGSIFCLFLHVTLYIYTAVIYQYNGNKSAFLAHRNIVRISTLKKCKVFKYSAAVLWQIPLQDWEKNCLKEGVHYNAIRKKMVPDAGFV